MQKKTLRLTTRGEAAYNVTKSLIKEGFFLGGGGEAIWRIVRTSEKTLATSLAFFLPLLKRNR